MVHLKKANDTWADSLAVGKQGESLFKVEFEKTYPGFFLDHLSNKLGQEKGADFKLRGYDVNLEVKTDSAKASDNFFAERYSNTATKAPGGVMQALTKNCDLYAVYFPNEERNSSKRIFLFGASAFALRLLILIDTGNARLLLRSTTRGNASWCSESYVLPKRLFEDLMLLDDEAMRSYLLLIKKK